MICRSASEPMREDSKRGYHCANCKTEVQVSPTGRAQMDENPDVIILCNPCGLKFYKTAKDQDKLGGVVINPDARKQLLEWLERQRGNN